MIDKKNHYFDGSRRYLEAKTGMTIVNVHAGDCFVTANKNEIASTILGSCIAACICDPEIHVGGMNHFLLPDARNDVDDSARFGAFAMESLINEILKRGGKRERLQVKIFGGGNVIQNSAKIGSKNIEFVKNYLENEGLKIISEDVGGELPRRVRYRPCTGKAMVMKIEQKDYSDKVLTEENKYKKSIAHVAQDSGDVDLF